VYDAAKCGLGGGRVGLCLSDVHRETPAANSTLFLCHSCVCEWRDQLRFISKPHASLGCSEQAIEPMMPELLAACSRLNVNLVPDDSEGGYAFVDDASSVRPWDAVSKLKTNYLNCVNGVLHNNEQIGILVGDLKTHRDELAVLKARHALAREYASLSSTPAVTTPGDMTCLEIEEVIKQQRVALEHCKLDLMDRLNARRHKEQRRKELADGILRRVCSALQLAVRLAAPSSSQGPPASNAARMGLERNHHSVATGGSNCGVGTVRRRRSTRIFSDSEIKDLLRGTD
jgi:hypothetical protein